MTGFLVFVREVRGFQGSDGFAVGWYRWRDEGG